jgi:hypothetical protein
MQKRKKELEKRQGEVGDTTAAAGHGENGEEWGEKRRNRTNHDNLARRGQQSVAKKASKKEGD